MPGLTVPGKIEKMGYKGVDTTELILEDVRVPAARVLGGVTGRGFYQMMDGVEVGRVNVAARGCGVALRAFELAIDYAQRRYAFGKPISQHEAIAFKLAEMATKVEAAHQMMVMAARRKDSGHRNDLEAGMAKYLASEYGKEVVEDSFRIHGGYGFSKEYEIERLYREAPMLLIGEGTAEIQKMIIGRRSWRNTTSRANRKEEQMHTETMDELLGSHPFFAGLSADAIRLVAGCASNVHFAQGEYIFSQGEAASRFYVLRHGRVAMEIHSPERGPLVIDTMDEGEVLGWSWLIPPYQYFGDARAVTPVSATALDGACLRGKCEADAELGYQLLKRVTTVMYKRLQSARVRLLDLYGPEPARSVTPGTLAARGLDLPRVPPSVRYQS